MMKRLAAGLLVGGLLFTGAVGAMAEDADDIHASVAFTFADPRIDESSGLVAADGLAVTVNDSGDSNRIFTVDMTSGETVGLTSWPGDAVDIEALAPAGHGQVWVGDIGDNQRSRTSVTVTKVPFGKGDRTVSATSYELVYPDGPHDAETLLRDPASGRLFVVAKEWRARVYAAPVDLKAGQRNHLTQVEGNALGFATDGAFLPDGRHIVVRGYTQAGVYTWPGLDRVGTFDLPAQRQGEGLAVLGSADLLLSSEGTRSAVLRVELPTDLQAKLKAQPQQAASPATEPESTDAEERDVWPWAIGGVVGLVLIAVLIRALRRR
ncbi:MAG: hypothetical protein L0H31_03175 [Nocardioidaceae bacterium]|nr:hypothetical protein [Nocardioidaceae bacterium]